MKKNRKNKKNPWYILPHPMRSKKLYYWLLWGFLIWFVLLFFVFQGLLADLLETPAVPDWAIPYDKQTAERVRGMTDGYPISAMSEYIARFDEQTAGYLIGIAKKESDWGRHVPVSGGKDCYNYWGFRDPDNKKGSGGHSCFKSPEQAVRAVGKRIQELVHTYKRDTAKEMVIWKCGRSCNFSDDAVGKWVSDVDFYYDEFMETRLTMHDL